MKILTTTIAKYLFAIPFAVFGLFHFMNAAGMAETFGPPGGEIMIYFTGAALIAAAISIIIGKFTKWACLGLALMFILFVVMVHVPMAGSEDEVEMAKGMTNLLKDLSLAGAALTYAGMSDE
jgi:putative oxidoreductase